MTNEETELADLRSTLASAVRKRREKLQLSQKVLAARLKTSQPRVAKIEQAASDVSMDQILRAYAVMGGRIAIKELSANGDGGKRRASARKKVKV
jgi:ribosome-binding protein aMBF1 (putative translation factor)